MLFGIDGRRVGRPACAKAIEELKTFAVKSRDVQARGLRRI
jgi:hypothetical protein